MALATGLGLSPDDLQAQQQPGPGTDQGTTPAGNTLAPTLQPSLDPNAASPYQPLSLPTVEPTGTVASALPPEQEPQHLGAASQAGQFAYMADKLLRGAAQGFDLAQRQRAEQAQKKVTALKQLYDESDKQYRAIVAAGIDPNSEEYKAAHNRVTATWQAMGDAIKSQLPPQKLDKNGQPKKDSRSVIQRLLQPENPTDALGAWYQVAQQLGPPVFHETAPMLTDAYRAKVQQRARTAGTVAGTQETQAGTAATVAETQQQQAGLQQELQSLEAKRGQGYSDQDLQRLTQLRETLYGGKPDFKQYKLANGQMRWYDVTHPSTIPPDATAVLGGMHYVAPKQGAYWDPANNRYVSAMFDGNTGEVIKDSIDPNKALPSYLTGKFHTGQSMVKDENGMYVPLTTSSSSGVAAPGGGVGVKPLPGGGSTSTVPGAPPTTHSGTGGNSATPTTAGQPQGGGQSQPQPPHGTGVYSRTPEQTKALEDADLQMKNYRNAVALGRSGSPTDQQSLVMAYVRSQVQGAGRMTNTEIQNGLNAGTWGERFNNAWSKALNGTLDPDYIKNLVNTIGISAQTSHTYAQGLMHNKPTAAAVAKPAPAPASAATPAAKPVPVAPGGFNWNLHPLVK